MRTPEEREALIDKILDEYEGAVDKYNRDQWNSAYGERLGSYSDKMKALKGDDYDIMNESYDEYNSSYKDKSPDEYIDMATSYMDDLFERLKSAVASGDTEEVAEVAEEIKEEATEEAVSEEPAEETPEEETTTVETNDPEVAEDIVDEATDEDATATSDQKSKFSLIKPRGSSATKSSNGWLGSPHTSGGRDGKTSDENCKESTGKTNADKDSGGQMMSYGDIGKAIGKVGDKVGDGSMEVTHASDENTKKEPAKKEESKSEDRINEGLDKLSEQEEFANKVRSAKARYGRAI